jgi:hypothetical protein
VAANGKLRQKGLISVRELRATTADVRDMIAQMAEARRAAIRLALMPQNTAS